MTSFSLLDVTRADLDRVKPGVAAFTGVALVSSRDVFLAFGRGVAAAQKPQEAAF